MDKLSAAIVALLTVTVVGVGIIATQMNQQTITLIGEFEAYIDNQRLLNGSILDWGIHKNVWQFQCELSIRNIDSANRTYTLYLQNIPQGWIETWTANQTSTTPDTWTNGTLTLTIPSGTKGTFTFGNMTLIAT